MSGHPVAKDSAYGSLNKVMSSELAQRISVLMTRVVGIDAKTLRKHYRDELDTGHIKATAKVAEFLFRKATTDGSQAVTAAIFWLKTRAGADHKPDRVRNENTSPQVRYAIHITNETAGNRKLANSLVGSRQSSDRR